MFEASGVQICQLCQKPFNQGQAYKRHISYCRKRQDKERIRKRPCRSCQLAKVKCTEGAQCQRCMRKGIECSYGSYSAHTSPNKSTASIRNTEAQSTETLGESAGDDLDLHNDLHQDRFELSHIPDRTHDIPLLDAAGHLDDPSMLLPVDRSPGFLPQPYHLHIEPNQDWSSIFDLDPYVSSLIPNEVDKWVLRRTPMSNAFAETHSRRLIRMLRSIPRMMVRRDNFPPFIHSHWQHDLPAPLANCTMIARLFCTRGSPNSTLVWNAIRLEQQRLARETYDFSKEDLMAALQAYLVYMIMRADDDTNGTAGDVPMLLSLKALTDWCYHLFGGYPVRKEAKYDSKLRWETWVFEETQRRCALLYFLIGRVFNVFTGNVCPCTSDPLKLPLPAPRQVWEARTEEEWSAAYQELLKRDRLGTFGDLLQEMQAPTGKLEEWQCGMDYLGSLLELAIGTF